MIDKFLKIAGTNNLDDFYKLHPTEEHFFKAYPHAKAMLKKPSKIRRPKKQMGGTYQNGGFMDTIKQVAPLAMQLAPLLLQDGGSTDNQDQMGQILNFIDTLYKQTSDEEQISKELMNQLNIDEDQAKSLIDSYKQQTQTMQNGGNTEPQDNGNYDMVLNNAAAIMHHANELKEALSKNHNIPAWVVDKIERASTDISDVTHYLDGEGQQYKKGGWIQKAVNPAHKGYCTPMTKSTCTPRRKALAKTFKKYHGFHQDGGYTYQNGGEAQEQPQQEMQETPQMQGQEQQMGQEQQQGMPQDHQQMVQQLVQIVVKALQQGTPPEQIVQMLVQQGIPQEVATQVVQMVVQQSQQSQQPGQQYQPQGNQYQGPQSMQQQPQAQSGGMFFNQSYSPLDY
jgi:hypothetical protein